MVSGPAGQYWRVLHMLPGSIPNRKPQARTHMALLLVAGVVLVGALACTSVNREELSALVASEMEEQIAALTLPQGPTGPTGPPGPAGDGSISTAGPFDVIEAREFLVVDAAGVPRAGMNLLTNDEPNIFLLDREGNHVLSLEMTVSGPKLFMSDLARVSRVELGVLGLSLTDDEGQFRIALDETGLVMYEED